LDATDPRSIDYYDGLKQSLKKMGAILVFTSKITLDQNEISKLNNTIFVEETEKDYKELEIIQLFAGNYHFVGRQISDLVAYGWSDTDGLLVRLVPSIKKLNKSETDELMANFIIEKGRNLSDVTSKAGKTEQVKVVSADKTKKTEDKNAITKMMSKAELGGPAALIAIAGLLVTVGGVGKSRKNENDEPITNSTPEKSSTTNISSDRKRSIKDRDSDDGVLFGVRRRQ